LFYCSGENYQESGYLAPYAVETRHCLVSEIKFNIIQTCQKIFNHEKVMKKHEDNLVQVLVSNEIDFYFNIRPELIKFI